jgi:DNA sulfur modification protein DndD
MILDTLTLENVGTFGGKQTIELTPPSLKRPIVLIGGLNGAGKTTILESIHLAMYGPLSQAPGRRAGSYENYLRGLIHHGAADTDGAAVDLSFHVFQQGEKKQFRIRRRWRVTGASVRESLMVWVNGRFDDALTASWNEHIETFLPRGIAGLFFFDGEQIEALADLERSRQVLHSALAALLGLDIVERLKADLTVLRRRHRGAEIPPELKAAVEERKQAATAARQAEEAADAAAASARNEAERAAKKLYEVSERYRAGGGELLGQRDAADSRVTMLGQQLRDLDEDLRHEASEVAPFLQLSEMLDGLIQQVRREQAAARDAVVIDVLRERDREMLDRLQSVEVTAKSLAAIEEFLTVDVDARRVSAEVVPVSGLSGNTELESITSSVLPATRRRISGLLKRREALRADIEQAERTLAAIPHPEALMSIKEEMDRAVQAELRCNAALSHAEDNHRLLCQERGRADGAYETALEKSALASLDNDDDRRLIEHIDRVRGTLESLKAKAAERHLGRISELVQKALTQLLRKSSLVTQVQIDPVSYSVQLSGPGGRPLEPNEMSAGERQLLAVSLLWGLAQAAGQPLPMVIDTPLGRLDGSHRSHLLERYFPHASHQVIMLSTDTEVDEAAMQVLQPHLGHTYRLDFDHEINATTITPGYFWGDSR